MSAPEPPLVMVVSDRRRLGSRALADLASRAARAGADFVQVREKDLADGALLRLTREVVDAVAGTTARVLVNGRPDVACAAGAHGVQLPEEGLPVEDVRRAFPALVVGASCHSVAAARRAAVAGAHLVVFGPVFGAPGKEERATGAEALARVARAVAVPVIAIGGMTPARTDEVRRAGAAGIAGIRAFVDGREEAVAAIRAAWAGPAVRA